PGWTTKPSQDYVLMLVSAAGQSISLDVPDLPVHLPGMIPIGLVKNGYLDDLRKRVGSLTVVEDAPRQFPDANAHLVHTTWSNGGQEFVEVTQLFVHNDRVYIIRSDSTADAYEATRAAFDAVVQSIRWIKNSP
ncbi:MAG TPA: DcrB-related protein, partial [Tepidisphaeraceae bacterium]|nr:DcrB-related protein [Tepidisphaeraceae bacterium]